MAVEKKHPIFKKGVVYFEKDGKKSEQIVCDERSELKPDSVQKLNSVNLAAFAQKLKIELVKYDKEIGSKFIKYTETNPLKDASDDEERRKVYEICDKDVDSSKIEQTLKNGGLPTDVIEKIFDILKVDMYDHFAVKVKLTNIYKNILKEKLLESLKDSEAEMGPAGFKEHLKKEATINEIYNSMNSFEEVESFFLELCDKIKQRYLSSIDQIWDKANKDNDYETARKESEKLTRYASVNGKSYSETFEKVTEAICNVFRNNSQGKNGRITNQLNIIREYLDKINKKITISEYDTGKTLAENNNLERNEEKENDRLQKNLKKLVKKYGAEITKIEADTLEKQLELNKLVKTYDDKVIYYKILCEELAKLTEKQQKLLISLGKDSVSYPIKDEEIKRTIETIQERITAKIKEIEEIEEKNGLGS